MGEREKNCRLRMSSGREFKASAHANRLFLLHLWWFYKIDQLRCTPREYGLSGILRVANDAVPDESRAVGKNANNADADRGFFEPK